MDVFLISLKLNSVISILWYAFTVYRPSVTLYKILALAIKISLTSTRYVELYAEVSIGAARVVTGCQDDPTDGFDFTNHTGNSRCWHNPILTNDQSANLQIMDERSDRSTHIQDYVQKCNSWTLNHIKEPLWLWHPVQCCLHHSKLIDVSLWLTGCTYAKDCYTQH